MIAGFRGRHVEPGEIVKVHRNLADPDGTQVWSILARRDGADLVVGHAGTVVLHGVEFRVRPAGHAEAVRSGQRNVHAFAVGRLADAGEPVRPRTGVHYSPFRAPTFTDDAGEAILSATRVLFDSDGHTWAQ